MASGFLRFWSLEGEEEVVEVTGVGFLIGELGSDVDDKAISFNFLNDSTMLHIWGLLRASRFVNVNQTCIDS